ncbi:uncharacterized protein LOC113306103 [Papaver somniferum]|uniref:uncharacterized protein LOC113306103 n=1 Tax=Papaver somniferum TaxID=3469 RepID=UPI000E6F9AED|nr:uncharacterized protein LOC113306103 [Papaver somniferum]
MEHLLFSCSHARKVWRLMNINVDEVHNRGISISQWVESWFINNNGMADEKLLYTMMISAWIIWKDRCDVVFQGVSLNPFGSMHKIHYHLQSHMPDLPAHMHLNSTYRVSHWQPPIHDTLKFNVDASFNHDTNQLGTVIVLRSHTGTCEGIKGRYADGILSPEMGECMAIREALAWAKEKKFTKIHIEADAKLVI